MSTVVEFPKRCSSGIFMILVGPSGSGKSTAMNALLASRDDFTHSISYTTRSPRGTEKDGVDYNFITTEEFKKRIENDDWLEYAHVFATNYYGTSKSDVQSILNSGKSVIKDVDVQGAMKIRKSFPEAVQVFLVAPSMEETERRLRGRGTDSDEVIQRRLAEASKEISHWREFDYVVINENIDEVTKQLNAIITAEKMRPKRIPKA